MNLEINLFASSSIIRLDHVSDSPSKLLRHQETLDVEGELTLIGMARRELEGDFDAFMSGCAHL